MGIRDAYNTWAASYDTDRNLTRDLDEQVTKQMLSGLRCGSILELGCGTGKNTVFLAQIGQKVQCLDFSEAMLVQARAKLSAENVTFMCADLTQTWPCDDRSADLVVCNLVLEHIAGLDFIFAEAFRCLVERGRFFVCELHPFRQYRGSQARFQRDESQVHIPAYVHHISSFTDAAGRAGFTLVSLKEWWHDDDQEGPPRLVSFMFER